MNKLLERFDRSSFDIREARIVPEAKKVFRGRRSLMRFSFIEIPAYNRIWIIL